MAIVQCTVQKNMEIFGQLLQSLKSSIILPFQQSSIIVLLSDRYDIEPSIKNARGQEANKLLAQKYIFVTSS